MPAYNDPIGVRFSTAQRQALDALVVEQRRTVTDVVRDAALQAIAADEALRVRTHLLQTATLLEMYHATPDSQALLRAPLRQWLREAMRRLTAYEAQLQREEGQP